MKREDMSVGMRIRCSDRRGGWIAGAIYSMPSGDGCELVAIRPYTSRLLLARFDDEIELPGATARKDH